MSYDVRSWVQFIHEFSTGCSLAQSCRHRTAAWVTAPQGKGGWGGGGVSLFPLTPAKQAMRPHEPGRAGMWLATRDQLGRFIADPLWDKETALALNVTDDAAAVYRWGYPGKSQSTNSTLSACSISVHSSFTQRLSHNFRCLTLNGFSLQDVPISIVLVLKPMANSARASGTDRTRLGNMSNASPAKPPRPPPARVGAHHALPFHLFPSQPILQNRSV